MVKVGIYGASGYTGQELLRLLLGHPEAEPVALTSRKYAGRPVADVYPVFRSLSDLSFIDAEPEKIASLCDFVFLAVPHGEAMEVVPRFLDSGVKVIDLSADFRIRDVSVYEWWYKNHTSPHLIGEAVYGLPELYRDQIMGASLVANPGCYPTSAILGLAPLLERELIDADTIVIDSKSGTSGAGREAQLGNLFCEVNEAFKAYKIGTHRHTPEIDQELSSIADEKIKVLFAPHLLPVNRGILTTIYAGLRNSSSSEALASIYRERYADERFVRVCPEGIYPNISSVRGSNYCDIGCFFDVRSGKVIVVTAIDNLVKGASGQAVQNMNLMMGFPEDCGLKIVSIFP